MHAYDKAQSCACIRQVMRMTKARHLQIRSPTDFLVFEQKMGQHSTKRSKSIVYLQVGLVECLEKTLPTFYQLSTSILPPLFPYPAQVDHDGLGRVLVECQGRHSTKVKR